MDADQLVDELEEERKAKGVFRVELARKLGVSEKTICRFFRHQYTYSSVQMFENIANALAEKKSCQHYF